MSVTDPRATPERSTDVRGPATDTFHRRTRETTPWFMTTEFWMTVIGIGIVAAIYHWHGDVTFNLWRAAVLGTVIGVAYIVSRGMAKASSHDTRVRYEDDEARHY